MLLVLLIVVIFCGFGGFGYSRRDYYATNPGTFGGIGIAGVLLLVFVLWLLLGGRALPL